MDIQYAVVLTLAVVAGLVGGVASSWLFLRAPLFAHKTPQVAEVIRARSFELVDEDGELRAALTLVNGEPFLGLKDKNDKLRAALTLVNGEPFLGLRDKDEKVIWSAP